MDAARLKKWLTVLGMLYLALPRDLIPDYLGRGLGFLDDLIVIAGLVYFYRGYRRSAGTQTQQERPHQSSAREGQPGGNAGASAGRAASPYETLGVDPSATQEEIRAAYRARMHEYHPDKVAHLGEDLQALAHRKATEIQRAFETLRSPR